MSGGVDVVYDVPLGGLGTMRQVSQSSFSESIEVMAARMSGAPVISDQFIQSANPIAEVAGVDIGSFLTMFGTAGGQIANGAGVIIPYHKRVPGGTFYDGSANVVVKGVLNNPVQVEPVSITAPTMGSPVANGRLHFLSADGITRPWDVLANQALVSQDFIGCYGLGPVFVDIGSGYFQVPRQIGFTVNFGIGFSEKKHFDGAVYPTEIYIEEMNPSIEFNQEDFDLLAAIAGGKPITGVKCWLRRRASGGTYVADNVASHIKFSFTSGFLQHQSVSASETKNGQQVVRCLGRTLLVGNGVVLS